MALIDKHPLQLVLVVPVCLAQQPFDAIPVSSFFKMAGAGPNTCLQLNRQRSGIDQKMAGQQGHMHCLSLSKQLLDEFAALQFLCFRESKLSVRHENKKCSQK